MRGTWLCRVSVAALSHLRAGVKGALRDRGNRASDREHDVHVHGWNVRSDCCRSGEARDIVGDLANHW